MPEEDELEKLKTQYPEIFKKLPSEVIDLVLSENTAIKIADICSENEITEEEKISKVGYYVGLVLLGGLHPSKLLEILKKEMDISSLKAEKIIQGINVAIFSSVKESLDKIYETGTELFEVEEPPEIKPQTPTPDLKSPPVTEPPTEEEQPPSQGRDIYREPIK